VGGWAMQVIVVGFAIIGQLGCLRRSFSFFYLISVSLNRRIIGYPSWDQSE
jgi:hypothetical protein